MKFTKIQIEYRIVNKYLQGVAIVDIHRICHATGL